MILKSLFYDKLELGQMTCMCSFALFFEWNCFSVPTSLIGPSFTNKSFKLLERKKKQQKKDCDVYTIFLKSKMMYLNNLRIKLG